MRILGRDISIPSLVLVVLALGLAVALVVGVATTGAAFAPFNTGWQGASELRTAAEDTGAEPVIATEMGQYNSGNATDDVAFVLAPEPRSEADQERLRSFVERGGRLVVATDDPGAGNAMLAGLGVDIGVAGPPLRDDVESLHGPGFPMATSTANHSLVQNTTGLALNYGTALEVGEDAQPLTNSSSFSYLDVNGDGEPGPGESLASRPIVAGQSIGDGEVIVVSDPSVFINAMLDHGPNRQFAMNLVQDRDRALLDRTDDGVPPLRAALIWLRGHPAGPALLGILLVGAILAWHRGHHQRLRSYAARILPGDAGSRTGSNTAGDRPVDRDALEAYLADRYPDWDAERRERVLGGVMADDPKRDDDATVD